MRTLTFLLTWGLGTTLWACSSTTNRPMPAPTVPSADDGGPATTTPAASGADALAAFPGSQIFPSTTGGKGPGILMLHGSEGGVDGLKYAAMDAESFTKAGFTVMFLCWYKCPGRPDKILRIELEHVLKAVAHLKTHPSVAGSKVGVFGISRGAEKAVLIGSLLGATDQIAAIAVHAPSDTVVSSYDPVVEDGIKEKDPKTGEEIYAPAWTWKGQDLFGERKDFGVPGPRIEAGKYPGPLLLSHGEKDETWPVTRSKAIEQLRKATPGLTTEAHYWAGEGHTLENKFPELLVKITTFFKTHLGGTAPIAPGQPAEPAGSGPATSQPPAVGSGTFRGSCKGLYNGTLETCEEIYGTAAVQCPAAGDGMTFEQGAGKCPTSGVRTTCPRATEGASEYQTFIYEAAAKEATCGG